MRGLNIIGQYDFQAFLDSISRLDYPEMIRLATGIFFLIVAVYLIAMLVRVLPVGSYKSVLWGHETTWGTVITIIVSIAVTAGLGIWLIWGY